MLAVLLVTSTGFVLRSDPFFEIRKQFTLFSEVFENLSTLYIEDVNAERLVRHGIDAMLEELDPYTALIDEAGSREMDIMTTGQYAGVGLEIGARGGQLVVIAPVEGYSAERRGVRAGDIIRKVDGLDVSRLTTDDLQALLRGDAGTSVTLTIQRYGIEELLDFELERERIEVRNVTHFGLLETDERIGYILLRRFGQNASGEVEQAIRDMQSDGPLDGLVLDLRNNPGGLLDEAVKIVDKFVPAGEKVVWTEGRLSRANREYTTKEPALFAEKPVIVLQNHGSASASEIVSGALQDLDRAVIIGERSFGKGLVQIVQPLSYNVSLKVTTSRYFTPSGRSIQPVPRISSEIVDQQTDGETNDMPFLTRSGREVVEGVGIEPDLGVDARQQSMLEIALLQNSHYFFFANEFVSSEESFDYERDMDRVYALFEQYLAQQNFTYTTRSERQLERFKASLDQSFAPDAEHLFETMKELVEAEKMHKSEHYAKYLRHELAMELLSRFGGQTARMGHYLANDAVVSKAITLLEEPHQYSLIMEP